MTRFPVVARILQALSIFGALFVLVPHALTIVAALQEQTALDLGFFNIRFNESLTLVTALFGLLPNAIVAVGLIQLARFGKLLAKGNRFTSPVSACLKNASILFVVGVIISWIIEPIIRDVSFAEAFWTLIENHGLLLLVSVAFSLTAVLLSDANEIEEENREFY
jgi:hypothetical protein